MTWGYWERKIRAKQKLFKKLNDSECTCTNCAHETDHFPCAPPEAGKFCISWRFRKA